MSHIERIDEGLQLISSQLKLPILHFYPREIKLKSKLPLFPFHKDWNWTSIEDAVIPFGVVLTGKKLHFNLLVIRFGKCFRFEPHRHATLFYSEKKIQDFLTPLFLNYETVYDYRCGTMCIEDAFNLVLAFFS
jgi:hypothetical protein